MVNKFKKLIKGVKKFGKKHEKELKTAAIIAGVAAAAYAGSKQIAKSKGGAGVVDLLTYPAARPMPYAYVERPVGAIPKTDEMIENLDGSIDKISAPMTKAQQERELRSLDKAFETGYAGGKGPKLDDGVFKFAHEDDSAVDMNLSDEEVKRMVGEELYKPSTITPAVKNTLDEAADDLLLLSLPSAPSAQTSLALDKMVNEVREGWKEDEKSSAIKVVKDYYKDQRKLDSGLKLTNKTLEKEKKRVDAEVKEWAEEWDEDVNAFLKREGIKLTA